MSASRSENYYCSGSTDPQLVHKSFDKLSPIWQFIDSTEHDRLEEVRNKIEQTSTTYGLSQKIRSAWLAQGLKLETDNYFLGMAVAAPEQFIPFVRFVEQVILEAKLQAVIVYWSRHSAAMLLPSGQRYRALMASVPFVSIFSEERRDPPEEWCFWTESSDLCLVLYGQEAASEYVGNLPHAKPAPGGSTNP